MTAGLHITSRRWPLSAAALVLFCSTLGSAPAAARDRTEDVVAPAVSTFSYAMAGGATTTGCVELADDGVLKIDADGEFGVEGSWTEVRPTWPVRNFRLRYELDGVTYRWKAVALGDLLVARVTPPPRTIVWAGASDCVPASVEPPRTTGLILDDRRAADGYVLMSPNLSSSTFLIDRDGQVAHRWDLPFVPGLIGYLLEDGSLVRSTQVAAPSDARAVGAGGRVERFDWDGNLIWAFDYVSQDAISHHDIEVLPNGNVLLLAWEVKTEAEATAAGRDPDLPGPGSLIPDHIVEIEPDLTDGDGGDVVWEWHVWDHLVQEFDATRENWYGPTGVEDHPELIDLNYVSTFDDGGGQADDWTHANGIDYHPEFDQIMVSIREFSEVWVIDHSTTTQEAAGHSGGRYGKGGDLLYRWGNPQAYDRGSAADRQSHYQHDAKWIEDGSRRAGNVTFFDNGFGRPGEDLSRSVEIRTPVDRHGNYPELGPGEVFGPAAPHWTYTADAEDFSALISGTQRLSNGNTLMTYGPSGTFAQVNRRGVEVWRYVNPIAGTTVLGPYDEVPPFVLPPIFPGLDSFQMNFTFRAIHYPPGYAPQLD